ncbi:glycosyltransferase family 39 protein [Nocardia wallacei]|uniref:glycosyltransferase family 39 protein n=1 Tax=Nocardia wallacei TaxID=480035 RepID=UPI00245572A4|nr:glycosyltransferase family 39 protein [Nocardia wallacei]
MPTPEQGALHPAEPDAGSHDRLPPDPDRTAVWLVAPIALVTAIVLVARGDRYDYFGDELYFLAAGRHLAPGYADQGPLIPLLARSAAAIAPDSLVLLRLPSILAAVAAVLLAAAVAREFGGRRGAQVLAAAAYATCPYLVTQAASLSTFALDSTLSAATVWLVVRWLRTRRDRLLLAAAVTVAVGLQGKLLIAMLLVSLAPAVLSAGRGRLLRSRPAWAAAAIVAVSAAPNLWWQHRHGWPQLAMGPVIRAEEQAANGGVAGLPAHWALLTGLLGGVLALAGAWALLWHRDFRPYRMIGVAVAVHVLLVVGLGGRPHYVAAWFPIVFAAGAVVALRSRAARATATAALAVSTAIAVAVVALLPLPLSQIRQPTDSRAELSTRMRVFGTSGWSGLVAGVEGAYRALPPQERAQTVIITRTYWQAAALDQLIEPGRVPVHSPNRGFAYFGGPPDTARTALYVTTDDAGPRLRAAFESAWPVRRIDERLGFPGIDRGVTVWRCDRPRRPWPALWADLTTLTLDHPGT